MITLFQITGSASFATRAALEEGGIPYRVVDVHPKRRDDAPGFAAANPLKRVATILDGATPVYETGAILLYLTERFPESNLGPLAGEPERAAYLRWIVWLANSLHDAWYPLQSPRSLTADPAAAEGIRARGREQIERKGAYVEAELAGRTWCLGERFSAADIYLYMLTGWQSYNDDGTLLGGDNVQAHHARVGARPAIVRTRMLDDLGEDFQRRHPDLRGGQPL